MAHPDIAASMARSMAAEAKQKQSAESDTTADQGAEGAAGSEDTSEESSSGEGDGDGADDAAGDGAGGDEEGGESGSLESDSDDTTADGEESDAAPEERASGDGGESEDDESKEDDPKAPKWEEDESKAVKDWFGKDADKVKPDATTKKLVKIARDNQAKVKELAPQIAALNDNIAGFGELILNRDLEGLNAIAEELGAEKLPFDTRTPEDLMKEAADGYNDVYDALEKSLKKDNPEAWALVEAALDPYYRKVSEKIGKLKDQDTIRKAEEAGRRAAGKPVKGTVSKDLEAKATQNFTDLKSKDPEAQARFDALKPYLQGGILKDKNRIYAQNHKLADELGKAVEFHANFAKKYLPKIKESLKAELKAKNSLKAPPSGRKPEGERPSGGKAPADPNKFNKFAGQKILERLRG